MSRSRNWRREFFEEEERLTPQELAENRKQPKNEENEEEFDWKAELEALKIDIS